jgi:hypothetical protein
MTDGRDVTIIENEDDMSRWYWINKEKRKGTFVLRYPTIGGYNIDGIILIDRESKELHWRDTKPLRGERVIALQAKRHRLGYRLMGQTLFTPYILAGAGALPMKTVALCGANDPALQLLLPRIKRHLKPSYKYEVCKIPNTRSTNEKRNLNPPVEQRILKYWKEESGGELYLNHSLLQSSRGSNNYSVHAIILNDAPTRIVDTRWVSLAGRKVTIVHSLDGLLRMYTLGCATFAAELAIEQKPKSLSSVVLVNDFEPVLKPVIKDFPYLKVLTKYRDTKG